MSEAEKMRVKNKWMGYLNEWIAIREQMVALDNAISEELNCDGVISFNNDTFSKLDEMNGIDGKHIRWTPKFFLYGKGEIIADALELPIYEIERDSEYLRFFIYKDYEFFWYVEG